MAKKYYAVKNGRDGDGIYDSWDLCKAQVHGVKSVIYKGFPSREQAEEFLRLAGTSSAEEDTPADPQREGVAVAYVDGSFAQETQEFGSGAVLFWQGEELHFSEKYRDPDLAQMHNVAGEIMGAETVIRYCLEQGIPALEIHHDYEGVGKWAMGLWKANKPGTQAYASFCRQAQKSLRLTFVKVKGHSSNQWNDLADTLARQALGKGKSER
ncbi:MAG: viroplasmin family protein [Acutalibacter sp.]